MELFLVRYKLDYQKSFVSSQETNDFESNTRNAPMPSRQYLRRRFVNQLISLNVQIVSTSRCGIKEYGPEFQEELVFDEAFLELEQNLVGGVLHLVNVSSPWVHFGSVQDRLRLCHDGSNPQMDDHVPGLIVHCLHLPLSWSHLDPPSGTLVWTSPVITVLSIINSFGRWIHDQDSFHCELLGFWVFVPFVSELLQ